MNPLRVLVVDDERPARAKVIRLLRDDHRFEVVGEAEDGLGALHQIEALRPDVVVIDIQMPGPNGFEVLDALRAESGANWAVERDFAVVFSTAYEAHALRAFDAHAVDYLLKPYDAARFRKSLDKVFAQRQGSDRGSSGSPREAVVRDALGAARQRLTLKTVDGPWVTLSTAEVLRISAANKHTCIIARDARHLVRMPLRDLAAQLDRRFVRVHRSEIVNVRAVVRREPWSHGDALLVLEDGSTVVLTRTYRREFLAQFRSS